MPALLLAQYWGERVTEESFEQSELYFTSHYLNTFGLYRFQDISVGLIDDPFLELYLNPANLPNLHRSNLIYLDFRGDRTEAPIIKKYRIYSPYAFNRYTPNYIDPRWYNDTRKEPEPIFSAGVLLFPFKINKKQVFLGGTYQIIHKQERFYSVPSWIYVNQYGYDVFGARVEGNYNIPIEDRYIGEDEMLNSGHLLSAFIGYPFSEKLNLGVALDGVIHSRDGIYMNLNNDEYGNTNDYDWTYYNERQRNQDYHHIDIAGGVRYQFKPTLLVGIKLGFLSGRADQDYITIDSSRFNYNNGSIPEDWSRSFNRNITRQNWKHEGSNWYGSLNLTHILEKNRVLKIYYRYTHRDVDLTNRSEISDTSYYASHWTSWDTTAHDYLGVSALSDTRNGWGQRKTIYHEGMINMQWELTERNKISAGIYLTHKSAKINSLEPVIVDRHSQYQSSGHYPYDEIRELFEDKTLDWSFKTYYWTIQIPVLINFKFNPNWSMMVGVNRILNNWKVEDETYAIFKTRRRLEDGELRTETNFGERYREPNRKLSEDFTDVIIQFETTISSQFKVHLLLDPEFKDNFRIAQWWLGFKTNL